MGHKTGRSCFIKDMFISEEQCLDRQALQGTENCEGCEFTDKTSSALESPKCVNCKRPGLTLPAKGMCGTCYNLYRKGELPLPEKKTELADVTESCTECGCDDVAVSPKGICGACQAKIDLEVDDSSSYPENECSCDLTVTIDRLKAVGPCPFCRKIREDDSVDMTPYYLHLSADEGHKRVEEPDILDVLDEMTGEDDLTDEEGDMYGDSEGTVYILLKVKFGWIAMHISNGVTYGGMHRSKSECLDGLTPLGYRIDMKIGKKWEES